jgi:hypothetical protein
MGNAVWNFILSHFLGWGADEIAKNGNRIKVAITAGVLAAATKLAVILGASTIPAPLLAVVQQGADWLANAILGGGAALLASWTVRAPGAPAPFTTLPDPPALPDGVPGDGTALTPPDKPVIVK